MGDQRNIVLVGGGHAHVHVMKALAERLPASWAGHAGVAPAATTPYSGMLPGFIAGIYSLDDAHIDLEWLATETGAHFRQTRAVGLDREKRLVLTVRGANRSLTISCRSMSASTPALDAIPGAARARPSAVKPIAAFVAKYDALMQAAAPRGWPSPPSRWWAAARAGWNCFCRCMVGSPAWRRRRGFNADHFGFVLVTSGALLATHNARVRQAFRRDLAGKGIILHEEARVTAIEADRSLRLGEGAFVARGCGAGHQPRPSHRTGSPQRAGARPKRGSSPWVPTLQTLNDARIFGRRRTAPPLGLFSPPKKKKRRPPREKGRRLCGARRPAARPQPDRHGGRKGTAALVPAESAISR